MTAAGANPVIDQSMEKLREIEDKIRELFDKVNDVMSWVPDILSDLIEPVRRGMNALNGKLTEFWDSIIRFINDKGDPAKLRQVAAEWSDRIGKSTGDVAGSVSLDKLKTNIEWSGRAAETYKATVPAQIAGLNSLKDLGLQIRNSLVNLANGLDSFWTQIYGTFAALAIAAVVAVLSAISVVGIPAAVAILVGMIGAGIASIFTTISAVDSLTNSIRVEQTAIQDKVDSLGVTWPRTNTESMSHSTDWKRQT
ncbi:hypothetical protein [Amycolatopsis azurea]|uniref:Uncharacterized protein n=2 Tax=Amycolatopsis azurea DSM 43854 TaxID=1238180 RepID=A0ABX3J5C0_9PSEU|nr:hypothetical protein [Amycolatopsis azurea]OOC02860.1 hypothetical protein B0293_32540 [Amycolatopsis azurea DSM 43854]